MIASRSIKVPRLKKYGTKLALTLRAVELCVQCLRLDLLSRKPGQGLCLSISLLVLARRDRMNSSLALFVWTMEIKAV